MERTLEAFFSAAELATSVLAEPAVAACWEEPSVLPDMSTGALAGHLVGAMLRTEATLDALLPPTPKLLTLAEFYGPNRVNSPGDLQDEFHFFVRRDGENRAGKGPQALGDSFRSLMERLHGRLPGEPADRVVPTLRVEGGVARLRDYMATRVVELVVHLDDLAVSAALPPIELPPVAASLAFETFLEIARGMSGDLAVIRAFTRGERSDPDTLRVL